MAYRYPVQYGKDVWTTLLEKTCIKEPLHAYRKEQALDYFYSTDSKENIKFVDGAYLEDIDTFDTQLFKLPPRDAQLMDPAQRLFMETAYHALEDAGFTERQLKGSSTGIYVGNSTFVDNNYGLMEYAVSKSLMESGMAGNVAALLPSRISYFYDLKGPSLLIDTGDTSGITAFYQACRGIAAGDCETALAGSVSVKYFPISKAKMENDWDGEGMCVFVLKSLDKALEDNNRIYAVVKGSVMRQNAVAATPDSKCGQIMEKVIEEAWKDAGVEPDEIGFIQCVGSPKKELEQQEITAIQHVLSAGKDKNIDCEVSSIHNIFGNQHEVSGLTAILSCVLCLSNKKMNQHISAVNCASEDGTNFHIVLKEPEVKKQKKPDCCEENLFVLSAMTQAVLMEMIRTYITYLGETEESLESICYTLQIGKQHFPYRLAIICNNKQELIGKLKKVLEEPDIQKPGILQGNYKIVPANKVEKEEHDITTQQQREYTAASKKNTIHEGSAKVTVKDLTEIANYYVKGAEVPFEELYKMESYSIVKTPAYAFEKEHMWFPTEERNLYQLQWERVDRNLLQRTKVEDNEKWLVIQCGDSQWKSKFEALFQRNQLTCLVKSMEEFDETFNGHLEYQHILFDISGIPNYMEKGEDISSYYEQLNHMYRIIKQFAKATEGKHAHLEIIGKDAFALQEKMAGNPFQCTMFSFAKSVAKDCNNITCNGIDLDESSMEEGKADILILTAKNQYIMVMRQGELYQQVFSECEQIQYDIYRLRQEGIYLVTGGMGGIGRTVAGFLASQEKINLALLTRRSFPEQKFWESIRDSKDTSSKDKKLFEDLCKLSKKTKTIEVVSCDISNKEQLQNAVAQLKEKYGQINGIVHSAGVSNDLSILERGEELLNEVIVKPKIQGTINLHNATLQEPLQFFFTFSSIATIFTSIGQTDYTVANTFLDEFTLYRRKIGLPASTVNWCTWKDKGMAHDSGFTVDTIFKAMESDMAMKGFQKVFMSTIPRVTIGYCNKNGGIGLLASSNVTIAGRLKSIVKEYVEKLESKKEKAAGDASKEFEILGRSDGKYSKMEFEVAKVFADILRFKEINIFDNFYDMGVDSISGMEIIDEINERLKLSVSIVDMLEYSKLYEFCKFIDEEIIVEPENDDIKLVDDYVEITAEDTDEDMEYVLSPSQKGIYLLNKIQEESTNYNLSSLVVLSKNFEIENVQKAVGGLIRRHEVFRTSFHDRNGELYQKIHKQVKFKVESEQINEDEVMERIGQIYDNFLRPFNLSQAPLFRMKILYTDKGRCFVMYDIHHIITDGISNEIIYKDILSLLKEEQLPPLDYTYKEYCVWMEERLQSGMLQPDEDYWLDLLKGELPLIDLPIKRGRTNIPSYEGAHVKFHIGMNESKKLIELAKEQKTTLFVIMLAYLNITLYKYSAQKDIIIGSPIMGRNNRKCRNIIGMFVNTMVLRNYVDPNLTMSEFINQVRKSTLEAIRHSEYPFSYIVEKMDGKRDLSRNPIFDIMFVLQNYSREKTGMDYFGFEDLDESLVSNKASKFDISFCAAEEEQGISFDVEYSTYLFSEEMIQNIVDDFCALVRQVDNTRDVKISKINILHEEEYQLVTSGFCYKTIQFNEADTANDYLDRAVSKYAEKTAITHYEQSVTYKEFGEKVNKLAGLLRSSYGVGREEVVGLYQDKTIDTLISLFAIWKAGAAFLPLDKTYPKERIDYMLASTKCNLILVNGENDIFDEITYKIIDVRTVSYEELSADITSINRSEDLAYIMFTSGSTGKPKGVMVEHRNLLAFVNGFYEEFGFHHDVVMLQQYSYTFDGFNEEVYTTLFSGSSLVMIEKNDVLDMVKLDSLITKYQINTLSCSALLFQQIGKYIKNSNLRTVISGGDVMKLDYVKNYPDDVALYNSYGPTEATCVATYYRVTGQEESVIPIGKSLANYKLYILDEYGLPRPIGVAGEIYIGGKGVSRGYLNNETLTSEYFNYWEEFQDRLYRTGDIGRWTEDGNIEFLGRDDRQIKIRGFRIEISEIEKYLFQYPGIEEVSIQPVELGEKEKELCCYIKVKADMDVQEVRKYLRARLPEYMVPIYYVLLEEFPYNQNGKIDVKKLPLPNRNSVTDTVYVAPRNCIEEQLAEVIENVLGVEKVGVEDNFFDVGVNSIKAIEIINHMVEHGFIVDINDLLENQDIASLAKHISQNGGNYFNEFIDRLKEGDAGEQEEAYRIFLEAEEVQSQLTSYQKSTKYIAEMQRIKKRKYNCILLLGSTGYLGSYIMNELLKTTDAKLYLIVRGKNTQHAFERIQEKYQFYFGEKLEENMQSRICVYAGDTTKPEFGLTQEEYNELALNIDCIVNSAAIVKHNGIYSEFLAVNVDTVKHCIAMTELNKNTVFHHISTISVGSGYVEGSHHEIFTEFTGNINQIGDNNYVNSKIEAEKIIEEARQKGLNICVYRVGNLVCNSVTGKFQTNIQESAFYTILRSIKILGKVPKNTGITIDFSFIDYVAKALSLLFVRHFSSEKNFHIYNPHQVSLEEVGTYIKESGYDMEVVPLDEFLDFLKENLQNKKYSEAISNLLIMTGILNVKENYTDFHVYNDYTVSMLGRLRFQWKDLNQEMMSKMLSYCEEIHFFKKEEAEQ